MIRTRLFLLLVVFWIPILYAIPPIVNEATLSPKIEYSSNDTGLLGRANTLYLKINYEEAIKMYGFGIANQPKNTILNTQESKALDNNYTPDFTIWSFLYLYVALIGFYTALVLNFNKKIDSAARILISSFIFIHSFFILNL